MVNNADWLDELKYIPLLRDIGRHFTVNRMLTFDSVRLRLEREQPLTFLEFNYMILQSYDFVELARRYGCSLQTGGSDQWGNIVSGVDLGRRVADQELFGLTCPLITTASGAKMGKTAAGAVWLNPDRLSPYEYYQFWRNTEDADVGRFLKLFTDLPLDEVRRLEALQGAEINDAKKVLAVRGDGAVPRPRRPPSRPPKPRAAPSRKARSARPCRPSIFPRVELTAGLPAYEILRRAGLAASNGEARRLDQRRRRPPQRSTDQRRKPRGDSRRRQGRRDQAVGRQEAPRPGARELTLKFARAEGCRASVNMQPR